MFFFEKNDDDDDATQAALQHRDNPSKGNCCPGHGGGDAQKGWNDHEMDEKLSGE